MTPVTVTTFLDVVTALREAFLRTTEEANISTCLWWNQIRFGSDERRKWDFAMSVQLFYWIPLRVSSHKTSQFISNTVMSTSDLGSKDPRSDLNSRSKMKVNAIARTYFDTPSAFDRTGSSPKKLKLLPRHAPLLPSFRFRHFRFRSESDWENMRSMDSTFIRFQIGSIDWHQSDRYRDRIPNRSHLSWLLRRQLSDDTNIVPVEQLHQTATN
jgi:hypothetical protein